jgi:hypothetical protein
MPQSRRVIITGTNKAGKSVVAENVHAPPTGPGNFDFWQTKPGQSPHDLSFGRSPMKFYPQPGGTMFRLFTIPPDDPNMKPADVAALQDWFFKEVGDPAARADTSRHPMMHTTATIDYIVLCLAKFRSCSMRASRSSSSRSTRWCSAPPITPGSIPATSRRC